MIFGFTFGAGAGDKPVWQKHVGIGVVQLFDCANSDVASVEQALVDGIDALTVFVGVGCVEVVKAELEIDEVFLVLCLHFCDQRFWCCAAVFSTHHDRCAVRIVGPDPGYIVAA